MSSLELPLLIEPPDVLQGQLRRLRRLTEGLINALRVEEVVQMILDHGFDSIPELSVGAINLLTEDGVALRIAGMRGAPSGLVMTRERLLLSFDTPGTRSARTGEAVWLPTREAYLTAYPHLGGSKLPAEMVQAVAAIPLQVERRVLGTLALTFRRPQSFTLEEREFFLTLGRLCAQALDRARLYEEERAARHQLAAAATRLTRLQRLTASLSEALTPLDIARVVVEEASTLLGADQALLMVPSEDGRNLLLLGHHGLAPEAAERWAQFPTTAALPAATAYQICVPLWLESPEDIVEHYPQAARAGLTTQALAYVPLLVKGNAIGVVGFGFKSPRRFIEEDRALLGDLARQTAQALERARLYDAEQRAHSRLQVLADAAAAFSEHGFDLTAVVETATRMVSEELGDGCTLRLVSRDGRWLEPVAAYYPTPEGREAIRTHLSTLRQRTDEGLLQTVMERGETLFLPSVPREVLKARLGSGPRAPAYEAWLDQHPVYSVLIVPLVFKGRVLGTLGVMRHTGDRPLSREDRLLVEGIGARAALAIENARLYEAHAEARRQSDRAAERTARLQAVTAALSEAVTPDDVARVMLFQAVSKVGGMAGVVFLVGEGGAELELLAASGYSDAVMAEYRRVPLVQPSPVCDAVIWGRPLYFEDSVSFAASYPDARPESRDLGGQALAVIPLVSPGGILGSLVLRFAEERRFDVEERTFLQSMADQCAQALERARLYQREQKTRAEAEVARRRLEVLDQVARLLAESQLDLQATCSAIARSVSESLGDLCLVLLLSGDGQRLEPVGSYHRDPVARARVVEEICKIPPGSRGRLAKRVLGTGESLLLPVVTPEELRAMVHPEVGSYVESLSVHSLLFVPIWSRHAVLGVLGITRDRPDRPYTLDDQRLLQQVADRAALAIENARLYSALRDNEARLAAILGSAMDAIVTVDERQRVVLFNTAAEYIFGISHGEALSQPIERFIPGGFPARSGVEDESGSGQGPTPGHDNLGVLVARRADGNEFPIEAAISPQVEAAGEKFYTVIIRDITDRRRTEEALREANRRKDEFLALLGHELRNPLAPIVTALHLMKLRGESAIEPERAVIERQVQHMNRLVDDLLDVARITRGKIELRREPVELWTVVARAIEMASPLLEQRSHHLTVDVPRDGMVVEVDQVRFAQVLSNLLSNAAKYTDPGGHIAISAACADDEVTVTVTDTGLGIRPEILPKLFEPFVQADRTLVRAQGGLGLGLALVKSLVALHGGRVSAKSEGLQRGSEFTVTIPAMVGGRPAAGTVSKPKSQPGSGPGPGPGPEDEPRVQPRPAVEVPARKKRVLIVDDNPDSADLLAETFLVLGQETAVAYDGPQALACVQSFTFDVALLDIGLPVMDGYELAGRLRELTGARRVLLIAVTGYGQEADRERSRTAGFDAHFTKPIDIDRLVAMVDEWSGSAELPLPGASLS